MEGRQAVRELLVAGRRPVREVWIARAERRDVGLVDLADLAEGEGVPVREVSPAKLAAEARSEAPQGVLAKARPLPEADLDALLAGGPGGAAPFLVALDGVTDPGNLGAVLRTAECAGVTGVLLPRHRAVHVTPTVAKAAAGAIEHLELALVAGIPGALSACVDAGLRVVGLDAGGSTALFDVALGDEPVCLVLGAEGHGLARLTRQRCDELVAIPLDGQLASLNVSVAAALGCFEVVRRRRAGR